MMDWIFLAFWILSLSLTVFGTWFGIKRMKSTPPYMDAPFRLYPVSILKPLKGIDSDLEINLRSFFELDYPDYQILFSVQSAKDPAIGIVRRLMDEYPRVSASLTIAKSDFGSNPKVNNLMKIYDNAENDLILISDSNVRVRPDYLKRTIAHLDNGVGVITSVVSGREPTSWGGELEAITLNSFCARGMYIAESVNQTCVVGKSMLFNRRAANRFGGLATLSQYLAEDYMTGVAMKKLGLKVISSSDPIPQPIGEYSFQEYWNRHVRWGRIRKAQAPLAFFSEILLSSIFSGTLGVWALHSLWQVPLEITAFVHFSVFALADVLLIRRMDPEMSALRQIYLPLVWLTREILYLPLWVFTMSGNRVLWKGNLITLLPGGLIKNET
jgi:ceramide glucosyltransferase